MRLIVHSKKKSQKSNVGQHNARGKAIEQKAQETTQFYLDSYLTTKRLQKIKK